MLIHTEECVHEKNGGILPHRQHISALGCSMFFVEFLMLVILLPFDPQLLRPENSSSFKLD